MMRTTLDIAEPVLKELRAIQKREGGSLGALVPRLLARAIVLQGRSAKKAFHWSARPMRARVVFADKEAVSAILDRADGGFEDPSGGASCATDGLRARHRTNTR